MNIPGNIRSRKRRENLVNLVYSLSEYWPLTVRAWHYRAFGAGLQPNTERAYRTLSKDLTVLRNAGCVPWQAVTETGRQVQQNLLPEQETFQGAW